MRLESVFGTRREAFATLPTSVPYCQALNLMARTALLAGATGLVGAALLGKLLANAEYDQVTVVGRRAPARSHAKLRFVPTTFDHLTTLGGALAADDVFCCLGTTLARAGSRAAFERVDYHMVVDLSRAARQAGSRRLIVVSAAGSSLRALAFYSRVKARMERAVAQIGFETVHIVRPSLLLGKRREHRPYEALAQQAAPVLSLACVGPLRPYRPVRAETVADAMLKLALQPATGLHVHTLPLSSTNPL